MKKIFITAGIILIVILISLWQLTAIFSFKGNDFSKSKFQGTKSFKFCGWDLNRFKSCKKSCEDLTGINCYPVTSKAQTLKRGVCYFYYPQVIEGDPCEYCEVICEPPKSENSNNQITQEQIGYIKKIYSEGNKKYLDIDYIQWLTATDGTCLSTKDEQSNIPECSPNGFLIVNDDTEIKTFEISENAIIKKTSEFAYSPTGERFIGFESFENLGDEHFNVIPYYIEIENGLITKITEQYIP